MSIELWLDQVWVAWHQVWVAVVFALGFMFIVNLPYTLLHEPMYSILTYTDWVSYVAIIGVLILCGLESVGLVLLKKQILIKRGYSSV